MTDFVMTKELMKEIDNVRNNITPDRKEKWFALYKRNNETVCMNCPLGKFNTFVIPHIDFDKKYFLSCFEDKIDIDYYIERPIKFSMESKKQTISIPEFKQQEANKDYLRHQFALARECDKESLLHKYYLPYDLYNILDKVLE